MKTPIKRNEALIEISKDHHHNLLLCWKIRTGFSKGIAIERIKKYVDWFYDAYIKSHFKFEETYIFPLLDNQDKLIKKALAQHRRLNRLFNDTINVEKSLHYLEEELQDHIRFEERTLFNVIQDVATKTKLDEIKKKYGTQEFVENVSDEFWI